MALTDSSSTKALRFPAAANVGGSQLRPSLGMSSVKENSQDFTPLLEAAFIQDESVGRYPSRPGPVSQFGTTPLWPLQQLDFSIRSVLLPRSPVGLGPEDSAGNFLYADLISESACRGTHPGTMVSKTEMMPVLTELGSWLSSGPPLLPPKDKPRASGPARAAHGDTLQWPQRSLQPSLRQEWS